MSNQKTTQLRRLTSTQVSTGDLFSVVDVSEITSPTGETKHITAFDLATYVLTGSGILSIISPFQGLQTANGLAFDETVTPSNNNQRCYGNIPALGTDFTMTVKGYVPSNITPVVGVDRVIFGAGSSVSPSDIDIGNSAYIGLSSTGNLVGTIAGVSVVVTNFLSVFSERAFVATLTLTGANQVDLYLNGVHMGTNNGSGAVNTTTVTLGNGTTSLPNIKCTIYEAHIFGRTLSASEVSNMFYRGIDTTDTSLVVSYNSNSLNIGPTQWLDNAHSHHILLATTGSNATSPSKRFTLSFPTAASGYLGDGSVRPVLPDKYILTSCIVESPGKPLLAVGSNSATAPVSASGTGSWRDNRVSFVSASYGVNSLYLLALGVAHADKTIYVTFSGSASPCTFSFDGYVRN